MMGIRNAAQFVSNLKKSGKVNRVLMTGASGQLGTELHPYLKQLYGEENVLMTDLKNTAFPDKYFQTLDVTDRENCEKLVHNFRPDTIIHNAAILSVSGEQDPELALHVNNSSAKIFIDMCTEKQIRLFSPSSIASFGPSTPKIAPNRTIQRPESIYGITKVYLELLGNYYNKKFGLDFRCVRYPVVISSAPAFHGTAACTVQIYHAALKEKKYEMYLKPETTLPIIYTDDVINGTLGLLEAEDSQLTDRIYNINSTNFTIDDLVESVKRAVPGFEVTYNISDFRQRVADSWPDAIDASLAKEDFGFEALFDLEAITKDMIEKVRHGI